MRSVNGWKQAVVAVIAFAGWVTGAQAALEIGDKVADFVLPSAEGGKEGRFRLSEMLARGPVVLYFFPAAFSEGCSLEAHAFAEAVGEFTAAGASVVGISADDIDVLKTFSVKACQSKFPVLADPKMDVIRAFDAGMRSRPEYASRITYVISTDGVILHQYTSLNPGGHVARALAVVRARARLPVSR